MVEKAFIALSENSATERWRTYDVTVDPWAVIYGGSFSGARRAGERRFLGEGEWTRVLKTPKKVRPPCPVCGGTGVER